MSEFSPKVTVLANGRIRIRQTRTVLTFEAEISRDDVPCHPYDRHQWLIKLSRQWHATIQAERAHVQYNGLPPETFTLEHLALASRFADAVEPRLMKALEVSNG